MTEITPTPRQRAFQSWERGVFLHFGLRTFYEGWRDFDPRPMDPAAFQPSALDCDQWAAVAKEAGFRYMIMTAKHHDGFANWPSATTDFSVARSSWRAGQGDVVREFTDACHRYGLKVGLYYSPYDAASPVYADERAYDDYFLTQVSELLVPYGQIDILWFDGCGSEGHQYDWPRLMAEVRRMQPELLIFNEGDPDIRWIGNEDGYAPLGTRNVKDGRWLCPECDARLRENNWFYSAGDAHTVKSVDELMGMYDLSCGRGSNLLLNVGPDRRGLLPEADAARLVEFGRALERRVAHPIATLADCRREGNAWAVEAKPYLVADHAVIGEETALGEHIRRFALVAETPHGGKRITLFEGQSVGQRAICRFPTVHARRLWLEVTEAEGEVSLSRLEWHHAGDASR